MFLGACVQKFFRCGSKLWNFWVCACLSTYSRQRPAVAQGGRTNMLRHRQYLELSGHSIQLTYWV